MISIFLPPELWYHTRWRLPMTIKSFPQQGQGMLSAFLTKNASFIFLLNQRIVWYNDHVVMEDVSSDTVGAVPHQNRDVFLLSPRLRHGHYIRQLTDRQDRQLSDLLIQPQHDIALTELSIITSFTWKKFWDIHINTKHTLFGGFSLFSCLKWLTGRLSKC